MQPITTDVKHARYMTIRDDAAVMGVHNAALLAGIAISETGLAHCYSESASACPGPASPSCNGDPVIAGGADGPCADMQGGLGMFQFDAGTYADTVQTYGTQILTLDGNTEQAVWFVIDKVEMDISGVTDWLTAAAWMDGVPMTAGDPVMEQWASLLACRYNGCCSQTPTCITRGDNYRDNAIAAYNEMGAAFWATANRCTAVPDDGVIDERSTCYLAAGDPRYWRHETTGYGGTLDWTLTTDNAAPANFAEWIIKGSGRYHLEVNLDGGTFGQSKSASYIVHHGGIDDVVVIDQSKSTGWTALGDFAFTGSGDEHVLLGDDTGEAGSTNTKLMFDALHATALDGGGSDAGTGSGGKGSGCGCGATGSGGLGGGVAFGAVIVLGLGRRRQTRS